MSEITFSHEHCGFKYVVVAELAEGEPQSFDSEGEPDSATFISVHHADVEGDVEEWGEVVGWIELEKAAFEAAKERYEENEPFGGEY